MIKYFLLNFMMNFIAKKLITQLALHVFIYEENHSSNPHSLNYRIRKKKKKKKPCLLLIIFDRYRSELMFVL